MQYCYCNGLNIIFQVDSLFVPPPILVLLSKHPLVKKYNLSSLREIRCGAAPLGKDIEHEIENKYDMIFFV